MPAVRRIEINATRSKTRGKFRVRLVAREGTYVFSVPQTVLGKLLYRIVKKRGPIMLEYGRKNALQLDADDLSIKGIRPVGKTAKGLITYTPIRRRPPKKRKDKTEETSPGATAPQETTASPGATAPQETTASPGATAPPTLPPDVSAPPEPAEKKEEDVNKTSDKKGKSGGRNKNKNKVATTA